MKKIKIVKNNIKIFKAPQTIDFNTKNKKSIFLAGSIEMGKAVDWQTKLTNELKDNPPTKKPIYIYNPRRDDWDSSWVQSIDNPQFNEQVTWELDALENSDVIALFFDPDTKSPISLLELGIHARDNKLIVCCPDGFWRKGNVDIVCNRFKIPMFTDREKWIEAIRYRLMEY